ncbi:MAG: hypothetical protein LBU87_05930 [Lactobacillales bacterium]|jgi:hypothetical protein|nr:hypothetical protein [Lactobacillales bacterium]
MKRWIINLICVSIAILSGVQLFMVKYKVIEKEEKLNEIYRQISKDNREIHMLRAEWAYMNDPERLKALIKRQTKLAPVSAARVIALPDIPDKNAPVPDKKPDFESPGG